MRNFHIKSILLGIGIGIVLTSIISMIYAAGINPNKSLSKEEIITKAKELGMVEETSILGSQQKESEQKESSSDVKVEGTDNTGKTETTEENTDNTDGEKPVEKNEEAKELKGITISVKPGETSETVGTKLLESGLISDKKNFIDKLTELGLAAEINVGNFNIKEGSSVLDIIRILTSKG